jgi:hypothetical protein
MFSFFSSLRGVSGNGVETYQCAGCRGLVTHSDRLLRINASDRHFFLNPAGVECDFYTFSDCPGWFPGYRWRMAFCRHCGQHLGWHYEAVSTFERPREFWGILVSHLIRR